MPGRDIKDISIFGDYKQLENRVTTSLLHILNVGDEDLIRFIVNSLNRDLPSSEINISTQDQQESSVPDGTLECSFKFKIFIESKVNPNAINQSQLENHKKLIEENEENILLYITPDLNKPQVLDESVSWINWGELLKLLNVYIENNDISEGHLLYYLRDNFDLLLENVNLITPEWNCEKNDRVVIFAGGFGEEVALRCKYYFCPSNRSIKPSGYVAYYRDWRIKYCFEINEKPIYNVKLLEIPEILKYFEDAGILDKAKEKPEEYSWIYEPLKVLKLGNQIIINEIENDKKNEKGVPIPFLYGHQRYTTIEKLKKATKTSQLI